MYNNPFIIPSYNPMMINPNLIRGVPNVANTLTNTTRIANTGGLFSKLGSSLTGIKTINWGGLINNTSKTLGIINQTIPLVRQVGPMINNMKSMLRVASLFKDETDYQKTNQTPKNIISNPTNNTIKKANNITNNTNIKNPKKAPSKTNNSTYKEEENNSPTFFINT